MTMLATASKPRGESSSEREMKLPAALLMRSVRGPVVQIHQLGCGFVAHAFAAAADMNLGAQLQKFCGHGFAEAGAASGHENAPPGKKLIVEHRFHPRELSLIGRLTKSGQRRSVKRQRKKISE